jgi:hypothetical protein
MEGKMNINISLSDAESMALSFVASSAQEWAENAVKERCRIATDEIVRICVEKCLETNTPIPNSRDAIVLLAFSNQWVGAASNPQVPAG